MFYGRLYHGNLVLGNKKNKILGTRGVDARRTRTISRRHHCGSLFRLCEFAPPITLILLWIRRLGVKPSWGPRLTKTKCHELWQQWLFLNKPRKIDVTIRDFYVFLTRHNANLETSRTVFFLSRVVSSAFVRNCLYLNKAHPYPSLPPSLPLFFPSPSNARTSGMGMVW